MYTTTLHTHYYYKQPGQPKIHFSCYGHNFFLTFFDPVTNLLTDLSRLHAIFSHSRALPSGHLSPRAQDWRWHPTRVPIRPIYDEPGALGHPPAPGGGQLLARPFPFGGSRAGCPFFRSTKSCRSSKIRTSFAAQHSIKCGAGARPFPVTTSAQMKIFGTGEKKWESGRYMREA